MLAVEAAEPELNSTSLRFGAHDLSSYKSRRYRHRPPSRDRAKAPRFVRTERRFRRESPIRCSRKSRYRRAPPIAPARRTEKRRYANLRSETTCIQSTWAASTFGRTRERQQAMRSSRPSSDCARSAPVHCRELVGAKGKKEGAPCRPGPNRRDPDGWFSCCASARPRPGRRPALCRSPCS
jgi:hypothetical protein